MKKTNNLPLLLSIAGLFVGGILFVVGGMLLLGDDFSVSSPFGGGSSGNDIRSDVLAFTGAPAATLTEHPGVPEPYTKDEVLADIDASLNILNSESEKNKGSEAKPSDVSFGVLKARFDELSSEEQEEYEKYILPPTDPQSFFHHTAWAEPTDLTRERAREVFEDFDWSASSSSTSYLPEDQPILGGLFETLFPVAHALTCGSVGGVDYGCFSDDITDWVTLESQILPIKVHIPFDVPWGGFTGPQVTPQYVAAGKKIRKAAEDSYQPFVNFFQMSNGPSPVEFYLIGDLGASDGSESYSGIELGCQQIYMSMFNSHIEATTAHELFHCFQEQAGILQHGNYSDQKKWMVEGGAEFGEHVSGVDHVADEERYGGFMPEAGTSIYDQSYPVGLYWYEQAYRDGDSTVASRMLSFAGNQSNEAHATQVKDVFHDLALDFSEDYDVYQKSSTAVEPMHQGQSLFLNTNVTEMTIFDFPNGLALKLPRLSMNYVRMYLDGEVQADADYIRVDLGKDMDTEDVEVSAMIMADQPTFKEIELEEDDTGVYFYLCFQENKPCDEWGETIYTNMNQVLLIFSNSSGTTDYDTDMKVIPWGGHKYRLYKVKYGSEGELPIAGGISLDVDEEEGTMRTDVTDFWIQHTEDFYDWDSKFTDAQGAAGNVTIHPSRLTNYVNNFCSFSGYMEHDFEVKKEEEEDDGRIKRTFDLDRTDEGDFHITPHQFICEFDPRKLAILGMTPESFFIEQFAISRLNTFEGEPGTFAAQQEVAFVAITTLGLVNDEDGEVEMYFEQQPGVEKLTLEFNDNFHAYFYKEN